MKQIKFCATGCPDPRNEETEAQGVTPCVYSRPLAQNLHRGWLCFDPTAPAPGVPRPQQGGVVEFGDSSAPYPPTFHSSSKGLVLFSQWVYGDKIHIPNSLPFRSVQLIGFSVCAEVCVTIITANHRTFLSPAKETLYPLAITPQHADLLVTTCPLSVSTDLLAPDIPQVGHHTPCGLVWILVLSRKSAGFISVVAGGGAVFTPASFPGGSVLTSSEQPHIYLPKPVSHPRNCQQRRASDGRRVGTACACGHSPRD